MNKSVDLKDPDVQVKKSVCYFCHNNCGLLVYVKNGKILRVEGDDGYPVNNGGLCSRGNINHLVLDYPGRVNYPLKRVGERGAGKWQQVTWDEALDDIAARLAAIKEEFGAEALATAGGTQRTDDWARRRFMNLYGSPNGFHNAHLCWIPTFMVETAIYGWCPFEIDMDSSRCLVLWGQNPGASTLPEMSAYFRLQEERAQADRHRPPLHRVGSQSRPVAAPAPGFRLGLSPGLAECDHLGRAVRPDLYRELLRRLR